MIGPAVEETVLLLFSLLVHSYLLTFHNSCLNTTPRYVLLTIPHAYYSFMTDYLPRGGRVGELDCINVLKVLVEVQLALLNDADLPIRTRVASRVAARG